MNRAARLIPLLAASAALVVTLTVSECLPSFKGVLNVPLLMKSELQLRTDQLLDGVVSARLEIGHRLHLGLFRTRPFQFNTVSLRINYFCAVCPYC